MEGMVRCEFCDVMVNAEWLSAHYQVYHGAAV